MVNGKDWLIKWEVGERKQISFVHYFTAYPKFWKSHNDARMEGEAIALEMTFEDNEKFEFSADLIKECKSKKTYACYFWMINFILKKYENDIVIMV